MNLAELFRHETDLQDLSAGQLLFKEGDPSNMMYVLMSGTAEVSVNGKVVETAQPGAIFGEMAMIEDSTRSASVMGKTDCKLLPIERARFNFLVQQTPNFALYVMRVMADRLRVTDSLL